MKYNLTRKLNLGRYGFQYETIDIGVVEAESFKEAEDAVKKEMAEIHKALIPNIEERLKVLNEKQGLTFSEQDEIKKLKTKTILPPF
jgi:hypothetical protein